MIGAKAAIIGAAELRPALQRVGPVARFQPIFLCFPIPEVIRDQRLLQAVGSAPFQVEDQVVFGNDLGRHQVEARLTQAGGLAEKQIRSAVSRAARRG